MSAVPILLDCDNPFFLFSDCAPEYEFSELRDSASVVGASFFAPEVLEFANVELDPDTPSGSLFGFSEKPPPARSESAARASEATAPVPSWISL